MFIRNDTEVERRYYNGTIGIISEFKEQKIDTQDGIRIDYNDKWLLFRNSNTEPIIRIFAESKSKECSIELIEKIKKICNE